ncbi:MAG: RNA pseudouridine synthase [Opitutaceae bacterium]|nr:RNA pseudouridine synthase [Opitutaceae bacterium]
MSELITFPPGVLGTEPLRLPIVARGDGWFAISKPAGLLLAADGFHPEDATSIVGAIHAAAAAGKPQLASLGIQGCARIHSLDPEASGVAVLASTEEMAALLRNHVGSARWEFLYDLVTEAHDGPDEMECDLPLLRHETEPEMIVSHRAGKRCRTSFRVVRRLGRHTLWEARTLENRPHQVRVHAAETGLRIVGEFLYARVREVYLSSLKRGYRPGHDVERPLHAGLALHLRVVRALPGSRPDVAAEAVPPKSLATLIRRLGEFA